MKFWNYTISDLYDKLTIKHILILSIISIVLMIALSLYRSYHVKKFKENRKKIFNEKIFNEFKRKQGE